MENLPKEIPKSELTTKNDELVDELRYNYDSDRTFEDNAKNLSTFVATKKAFEDESFIDEITENKKKELTEASKKTLKSEMAESKKAEKSLQESIFGTYDGIANLIGLQKSLPTVMLKVLMWLMQPVLTVVFISIGLVTGIINIFMDALNAIVRRFTNLAQETKKLIKSLFVIAIIILIALIVNYILKIFGIDLI